MDFYSIEFNFLEEVNQRIFSYDSIDKSKGNDNFFIFGFGLSKRPVIIDCF